MLARVMIDNIAKDDLAGEWGLSIFIEVNGKNILLDTGTTGNFAKNAGTLGIDLSKVDFGVLSHAHYDHSDGLETFFSLNKSATFFLREGTAENCYHKIFYPFARYIGIKKGTLEKYKDRIDYVSGDYKLCDDVYLIPHKTPGLAEIGKKADMCRRKGLRYVPDDFSHEQSLVVDTKEGLVIFSCCSHGGADNIINEVKNTFPKKNIYAIVGGFHLFRTPENEVHDFAKRVKKTGIKRVITGHCTGKQSYEILKEELPDETELIYSGYELIV